MRSSTRPRLPRIGGTTQLVTSRGPGDGSFDAVARLTEWVLCPMPLRRWTGNHLRHDRMGP
jgi:hypothetical protein